MKVSPAPLSVHFNSTLQIFPPRTILKCILITEQFYCHVQNHLSVRKEWTESTHCDAESLIGHLRWVLNLHYHSQLIGRIYCVKKIRMQNSCQHSFLTIFNFPKEPKRQEAKYVSNFLTKINLKCKNLFIAC